MRLPDFILAHTEQILMEWEVFARSIWPEGAKADAAMLRDDADGMLRATAADMKAAQTPAQQASKSKGQGGGGAGSQGVDNVAGLHGGGRHSSGFDLPAVISEYRALRASVIRLWRESHPEADANDLDDLTRFNESIDQSLTEAVIEYTRLVEQERQAALEQLHDANQALAESNIQQSASVENAKMLVNELDHRVKNTLATVSALCSQTMRESPSLESFREAFEGRIHALASAHRRLSKAHWHGAELGALVKDTMAPHQSKDQADIDVKGPHILLSPKATMTLAIVLHELSTNAAKHGALSHKSRGRVDINWNIVENGSSPGLRIHWSEKNSHPIPPPGDDGFGTRLMRHSVEYELNGRLDLQFPADGLVCTIDVPWTSEIGTLRRN